MGKAASFHRHMIERERAPSSLVDRNAEIISTVELAERKRGWRQNATAAGSRRTL
jgi:hypothetical protein